MLYTLHNDVLWAENIGNQGRLKLSEMGGGNVITKRMPCLYSLPPECKFTSLFCAATGSARSVLLSLSLSPPTHQ